MRRTLLAAETERALNRIRTAVEAGGKTLEIPPARGGTEYRNLALLRAIANALEGKAEVVEVDGADTDGDGTESHGAADGPTAQRAKAPAKRGGQK